jgi:O-antigen/teichoic acid export membrane protein
VLKSVGSQWLLVMVTVGATYVLVPFTLKALGPEGYGTWILLGALGGYMSLAVLGVPMASVRYMAQYAAEKNERELNQVLAVCAVWYAGVSAVAVAVGVFLLLSLADMFNIPDPLVPSARGAMAFVVLTTCAWFVHLIPYGIMAAHQDFARRHFVLMGGVLVRLGLTRWLLTVSPSIVMVAVVPLVSTVVELTALWVLVKRRYPALRARFADFEWSKARKICVFSAYVTLLGVGSRLTFQTDALVIGMVLPVDQIPYYAVANSFVLYLIEVVFAIASVAMPLTVKLRAEGRETDLRDVYLKWSKIALSVTLIPGLYLIVLGPQFIANWMGPAFEGPAGLVLRTLMISSLVYLPAGAVSQPILIGLGKESRPGISFLLAGIVNLLLSLALVRPLGLAGVAIGTAVPNVVYAVAMVVLACRHLSLSTWQYVDYVALRAGVGCIPVLGWLWWAQTALDVRSLLGLALAGVATVAVFGLTWMLFVYRDDRLVDVPGRLAQLVLRR